MANHRRRKLLLHRLFTVGMWVKGIDGVLEIIGGVLLLLTSPAALNRLVIALTQHELVEDPHDRIANAIRFALTSLSTNMQLFASVYLLAHGVIKIGVVAGVLRGHRWAYPTAIGFLGLFIAYQLYRLSYDYAPGLLLLTLFDIVMVGLTWREYTSSVRH